MPSMEQRVEKLESKVSVSEPRHFFIIEKVDGQFQYDGKTFPDLDSWKAAVGAKDNDTVVIVCLRDEDKERLLAEQGRTDPKLTGNT